MGRLLFAVYCSPSTIRCLAHYLLFTVCCSPSTVRRLLFTVHYSLSCLLSVIHRLLFTVCCSPYVVHHLLFTVSPFHRSNTVSLPSLPHLNQHPINTYLHHPSTSNHTLNPPTISQKVRYSSPPTTSLSLLSHLFCFHCALRCFLSAPVATHH